MSDRAILRWLGRVRGGDIDAIKAEILAIAGPAAACDAKVLRKGGHVFILERGAVVTIRTTGAGCRRAADIRLNLPSLGSSGPAAWSPPAFGRPLRLGASVPIGLVNGRGQAAPGLDAGLHAQISDASDGKLTRLSFPQSHAMLHLGCTAHTRDAVSRAAYSLNAPVTYPEM